MTLVRESARIPYRENLPQCESVRGIAILLVFWFHYLGGVRGYNAYPEMPLGLGMFFGGNTGVTLFFVLSGFLLTRAFVQGAPLQFASFFARRALRILPMFYFAVLLGGLWSGQWLAVVKALFFYDIKLATLWPMGAVWWSLVVEVQFYLLLPLLVWLARRPRWRGVLWLLLGGALYLYFRVRSAGIDIFWGEHRDSIVGRWPVFLLGFILAWVQTRYSGRLAHLASLRSGRWLGLGLALLAAIALAVLCDYRFRHIGVLAHVFWYDHYLLEGLCWSLFLFALLNFRFPGYRLFVNPLLHRLGLWSYSLYLLHSAVLFFLFKKNPLLPPGGLVVSGVAETLLAGCLALAIATVLSAITYRLVEQPFLRVKPQWRGVRRSEVTLSS